MARKKKPRKKKRRLGQRYLFNELISLICLNYGSGLHVEYAAMLTRRPLHTIRQKFRQLPKRPHYEAEEDEVATQPCKRVYNSIQDVYRAFGVPCPEGIPALEEDMYSRFKQWEDQMLTEFYAYRTR